MTEYQFVVKHASTEADAVMMNISCKWSDSMREATQKEFTIPVRFEKKANMVERKIGNQ
jgi:hypothetical protein